MPSLKIIFNLFYPPTEQLKKFIEQNNGVYFPINGGSSLDDEWSAKFIQKDSTGDNISHLNGLLNEMTSIYWFWKNANLPNYVGFSHYRRTFNQNDISDYPEYDIIVSKPIWSSDKISLAYQYKYYHVLSDLQTCIDVIRNEFSYGWGEGFRKYLLSSGTNLAPCNMFIMKKELFEEWCDFIFPVLLKLKEKICDSDEFKKRDNYQKRALCFLTERMFGYWYYLKRNSGLRTKEIDIVEHLEYKPDGVNERGDFSNKLPKVALVAIAKNEENYLKEWVDYNLKIGFTDIYVYQNNWRYDKGDIKDSRVHFEICDSEQPQIHCYNSFIENNKTYDFIAFFDIDEFLYIKSGEKVPEFLSRYPKFDAIYVNWRLFGDNGLKDVKDGNYSVLNRFTKCDDRLYRLGKPILNVRNTRDKIIFNNPHILVYKDKPTLEFRPFDPLGKMQVKCGSLDNNNFDEPCELYHYRNKTWEETLKRRFNTTDGFWPDGFKSRSDIQTIKNDFESHNKNILQNTNLKTRKKSLLCCIAKDEDNYIEEWIRYNLKLGFDKIVIYQNNWRAKIPDDIKDNVILISFDTDSKFAQQSAYNDCIEIFSKDFSWIAFFDIDEFLVIKKYPCVNQWLQEYSGFDSIGVNWKYFGDNGIKEVSDNNYSVTRFTKSQIGLDEHIKTIVNTEKCGNSLRIHMCCHCTEKSFASNSTIAVDKKNFIHSYSNKENHEECEKIAYLAHFRCKTEQEWLEKVKRNINGIQGQLVEYKNSKEYFKKFNLNETNNTSVRDLILGTMQKTALVAIACNEDHYLKEWIDYHLNIGFDDIYVFQNNWRYGSNDINDKRVHLETLDGPVMQNKCYNDFIENYNKDYNFIAFFDIDEFLYIKNGKDINSFLNDYDDVSSLFINWRLFGDNGLSSVTNGNYSVLNRFTKCAQDLHPLGKIILNTSKTGNSVIFHNPHILVYKDKPTTEFKSISPSRKRIVQCGTISNNKNSEPCELYHYRNKTWEELVKRRYNIQDPASGLSKSHTDMDQILKEFIDHNKNEVDNFNLSKDNGKYIVNNVENITGLGETRIKINYTAYLVDDWESIFEKHVFLLKYSGLYGDCEQFNIFYYPSNERLVSLIKEYGIQDKTRLFEQNMNKFEVPAIDDLICNPLDANLYFHTKGVSIKRNKKTYIPSLYWNDYMTYFNIFRYRDCLDTLNKADMCGVELEPKKKPDVGFMYCGNFWWSTGKHLDNIRNSERYQDFLKSNDRYICENIMCSIPGKYAELYNSMSNVLYSGSLYFNPIMKYEFNKNNIKIKEM